MTLNNAYLPLARQCAEEALKLLLELDPQAPGYVEAACNVLTSANIILVEAAVADACWRVRRQISEPCRQ